MADEPRGTERRSTAPDRSGSEHQPQYFEAEPSSSSRPRFVRLDLPDLSVTLSTDNSVFSGDRIDPGTKTLLVHTARRPVNPSDREHDSDGRLLLDGGHMPDGDLVDVGAGYGPIAITLARRFPGRTVWAIEPNERARALCVANADAAGVGEAVRVVSPEDAPPDIRAAAVYSNPPIRIGKVALHDLLERWLGTLVPDGEGWLVVQRHLGADSLARWLSEGRYDVKRMASRRGYRVLRIRCIPMAAP